MNIKDSNAKVEVEGGAEIPPDSLEHKVGQGAGNLDGNENVPSALSGFWVGYFERDDPEQSFEKTVFVDEGFVWNRENKINISIDAVRDNVVFGHSVVAGNDRPFTGVMKQVSSDLYEFEVREPGDDKYDGVFSFAISDDRLVGTWIAFNDIDIRHRKYDLRKRTFAYDPKIMLEPSRDYVNWNKVLETVDTFEMEDNEFEEWISREFATASNLIYEMNASERLLSRSEVENLKKGDLTIIRNTIYARHGYSFKNRPLRVFFDAQGWYIPVHTNIKEDFTDIEKENIQLLLRYEKNAAEYYDYFGRG